MMSIMNKTHTMMDDAKEIKRLWNQTDKPFRRRLILKTSLLSGAYLTAMAVSMNCIGMIHIF